MAINESSLMKMLDNDIRSLAKLIHERYPIVPEDDVVYLWWNVVQGAPDVVKNVKAPAKVLSVQVNEPQPGPSAVSEPLADHDFEDDERMDQLLANLNDELVNDIGSMTINDDVQDDELDAQDDGSTEAEEAPVAVKAKPKKAAKASAATVSLCKYKYTKKGPKQGQECGSRVKSGGNFCGKHKKHDTADE